MNVHYYILQGASFWCIGAVRFRPDEVVGYTVAAPRDNRQGVPDREIRIQFATASCTVDCLTPESAKEVAIAMDRAYGFNEPHPQTVPPRRPDLINRLSAEYEKGVRIGIKKKSAAKKAKKAAKKARKKKVRK